MTERFVVDTNAVVDLMRAGRPKPPQLRVAETIYLPIPVLGELYFGAFSTLRPEHHIALLENETNGWIPLAPDTVTAHVYGEMRAGMRNVLPITNSKLNDLWIAALCLQHNLPLLTNDRGFDHIAGLTVMHW